jgi:hypothetical protein
LPFFSSLYCIIFIDFNLSGGLILSGKMKSYLVDEETYNKLYSYSRANAISYTAIIKVLFLKYHSIHPRSIGDIIQNSKSSGVHNTKKVSFWFDDEFLSSLKDCATKYHSSISEIIRELVKADFSKYKF